MKTLHLSEATDLRMNTSCDPSVCVLASKIYVAACCDDKYIRLIVGNYVGEKPIINNEIKYYSGVDAPITAVSVAVSDNGIGVLAFCQKGKVVIQNFTLHNACLIEYGEAEALTDGSYVSLAAQAESNFGLVIVFRQILFRSYAGQYDASAKKVKFKTKSGDDDFDSGDFPKLALDKKFQVAFEIHEGGHPSSTASSWYHYASFYGDKFLWANVVPFEASVKKPCMGIMESGSVCVVYENKETLYYGLGIFESRSKTVEWTTKNSVLGVGCRPNVAFYGNSGVLLFVDKDGKLKIASIQYA